MSFLRRFHSRKGLLVAGIVLAIAALAMLHPYPRQSLFGPTIRGEPECVWESEIRRHANHAAHEAMWTTKLRRRMGLKDQDWLRPANEHNPELLPLLLRLSRDPDELVRRQIIEWIRFFPEWFRDPSAREVLLERLAEKDVDLRMTVADGHWELFHDTRVFPVLIKDIQDRDVSLHRRYRLLERLREMCEKDPALIPQFAVMADDEHPSLRREFMNQIFFFRKQGVPLLIHGLRDENADVRAVAVHTLASLREDAADAAPALQAMLLNERDREHRPRIQDALHVIDPARFPERQR